MLRETQRANSVKRNGGFKPTKKYPFVEPGFTMPHFEPLLNPSYEKQEFLKGDRDAVYYLKSENPNFTHYNGKHSGVQLAPDNKAKIVDSFRVTCAGMAIPDPQTVNSANEKIHRFRRDSQNIREKMFQTNAMSSIAPQEKWAATTYNSFKSFEPLNTK
jgi:hypothetical protein